MRSIFSITPFDSIHVFSGHIAEELWPKDYNFYINIALAIFNGYKDVGDKWMLYPIIYFSNIQKYHGDKIK